MGQNLPQVSIVRFYNCGLGSSQAGVPSFRWDAWQNGKTSRRSDFILFTSYVMTEKVSFRAA